MKRELNIAIDDTLFDPNVPPKRYRVTVPEDGSKRYRVLIRLVGDDLVYVRRVTYRLHPTFREPVRTVQRTPSNPDCTLAIWTWGVFEVYAEVEDKQGTIYKLRHQLRWDQDLAKGEPLTE